MLNRRRFVYTLAGLIAFGSGRSTAATAATAGGVSLEGLLTIQPLARQPGGEALLAQNRRQRCRPDSEQFTVVFQAPRELILLDGTYRITHVTAGTTDVFLQPAGHDDRSTTTRRRSISCGKAPAFRRLRPSVTAGEAGEWCRDR